MGPVEIFNDGIIAENHALLKPEGEVRGAVSCFVHHLKLLRRWELCGPLDLPDRGWLASLCLLIWVTPHYFNFARHFLHPLLCLNHHVLDHQVILLALVHHYRLILLIDDLVAVLAHVYLFLYADRFDLFARDVVIKRGRSPRVLQKRVIDFVPELQDLIGDQGGKMFQKVLILRWLRHNHELVVRAWLKIAVILDKRHKCRLVSKIWSVILIWHLGRRLWVHFWVLPTPSLLVGEHEVI